MRTSGRWSHDGLWYSGRDLVTVAAAATHGGSSWRASWAAAGPGGYVSHCRVLLGPPAPLVGLIVAASLAAAVATAALLTALLALALFVVGAVFAAGVMALAVAGAAHVARRIGPPRRRRPRRERERPGTDAAAESPIDALRRRYAAGEIGQTAFRQGLVDLLKARYVRGDLTLAEFESRVRHVLLDPALRPPAS